MRSAARCMTILPRQIPCSAHTARSFIATSRAAKKESPSDTSSHKYQPIDVKELLSKPTWSISSLLPPDNSNGADSKPSISSKQLHHLLRLSALPSPASPEEEAEMLATLTAQLHFVREIQQVDTSGVEPLQSLRDETAAGQKDAEVGLDHAEIQEALSREEVRGRFHRRLRRRKTENAGDVTATKTGMRTEGKWDVLGTATKKTGRYFVVEGGK